MCAAFGSLPLGHNHPEVIKTTQHYLKEGGLMQGMGDIYGTTSKAQLLEALKDFLPSGFERISLCVTGSDAVELAVKTALLASQKPGILACTQSYHGLSLGAMTLTGIEAFRQPFPGLWAQHPHVCFCAPHICLHELRQMIRTSKKHEHTTIGQMIIEPIMGRGGGYTWSITRLQELYEMLQEEEVLLIFDEVLSGLGRCGLPFIATEAPADLICMGKALGGGMPLSAVAASTSLMNHWPENRGEALHTGTFFGHALSCTVARSTLSQITQQQLTQRCSQLGEKIREWTHKHLPQAQYRGRGLLCFLEFHFDAAGVRLSSLLRRRRIIALPCGPKGSGLALTPAFNMPEDLLWQALEEIRKTVHSL